MSTATKTQLALDQKLKQVSDAPANFGLYVSLHDFVKYVESTPCFAPFFATTKGNRAAEIPKKYSILKQIYQGIEDLDLRTTDDLGHDRFVAIRELTLIKEKNLSENNPFWKNRENLRKLVADIHRTLHSSLSPVPEEA